MPISLDELLAERQAVIDAICDHVDTEIRDSDPRKSRLIVTICDSEYIKSPWEKNADLLMDEIARLYKKVGWKVQTFKREQYKLLIERS